VAKGLSYQEIGEVLKLRYHTIASYIKGIYRKLAVRSRGEAVFEARQMGLLE
jgi:DNA-binding CsgD family transcriptional regulator